MPPVRDQASWLAGFLSGYNQGYEYGRDETAVLVAHDFDPDVDVEGGGTGGSGQGAPARDLPIGPSGRPPQGGPVDGSSRTCAPPPVPVVVPADVEMALLHRGMLAALSGMVELFRTYDMNEAHSICEMAYRFHNEPGRRAEG